MAKLILIRRLRIPRNGGGSSVAGLVVIATGYRGLFGAQRDQLTIPMIEIVAHFAALRTDGIAVDEFHVRLFRAR